MIRFAVCDSYRPDMGLWYDMRRSLRRAIAPCLGFCALLYFGYHTVQGDRGIISYLRLSANLERTEWLLSRFAGYVGVTNYMGSKFTTSPEALRPVLNTLQRRGLMFLDTRSSVHSVAGQVANEIGLVQAVNNRFLDNKASRSAIDARLAELERIARATGSAIGIAFPYPVSIERIAAWAETLENRGLVLAPISNLAKRGVMSGPVENAEGEGETPSHHE